MKLSFSLIFFLALTGGYAQVPVPPPDTVRSYKKERPDSLKQKFYPRAIRVGTDLVSLVKTQVVSTFSGWELNADMDCGKIYLAVDYGGWSRSYDLKDEGLYDNKGNYWRAGADLNLLLKDPDRNMLFFGLRYGHSGFSESTTFQVTDIYFGDSQKQLNNPWVSAGWAEVTTGLRVKVLKELWLGYTVRMKFARSVSGDTEFKTYDIPGYGLNSESLYWGFNYQVFWRFPLKVKKKG